MTHTYDSYDVILLPRTDRAVYELKIRTCTYISVQVVVQMTKCMYRLQLFKLRWFRHPLDEVMREKAVKMTRPFF